MSKSKAPELKRIDFEKGSFVGGSGKTYYIVDSLPVDYWIQSQMLIPEVTYGVDFKSLHGTLKGAYSALTSGNEMMKGVRLAGDMLYNQMHAIGQFGSEKRNHPVLKMAGLWCQTEDEDISQYDDKLNERKVEDFRSSGIDMNDFFLLCSVKIRHFREIYLEFHDLIESLENPTPSKSGDQPLDSSTSTTKTPLKEESGQTS